MQVNIPTKKWTPDASYHVKDWIKKSALDSTGSFSFNQAPRRPFETPDNLKVDWKIEIRPPGARGDLRIWPSDTSIIADLFNDQDTSDVIFVITRPWREAKKEYLLHGHRKILSARSSYFKTSEVHGSSNHEISLTTDTVFESGFAEGSLKASDEIIREPNQGSDEMEYCSDSDYEDGQGLLVSVS